MDSIREQLTDSAAIAEKALIDQLTGISKDIAPLATSVDVVALTKEFNVSAPVPQNAKVMELYLRAQQETNAAINQLRMIKTSLMVGLPAVEDGNNFGVAVVKDVIDMAEAAIQTLKKEIETFPVYFKDRAAAVKAVSPKVSSLRSESTVKSAEESSKNDEQEKSSKDSTSTTSDTKTETPTALPDEIAHIVALDVSWYLKFLTQLMTVYGQCAIVCNYMEKNQHQISNPKGSGAGLSMF